MARRDVHPMPGGGAGYGPEVQADILSPLRTRMVVPLLAAAPEPIRDLNPVFQVAGVPHVRLTQAMASVPVRELRQRIATRDAGHDAVIRALDVLLTGV